MSNSDLSDQISELGGQVSDMMTIVSRIPAMERLLLEIKGIVEKKQIQENNSGDAETVAMEKSQVQNGNLNQSESPNLNQSSNHFEESEISANLTTKDAPEKSRVPNGNLNQSKSPNLNQSSIHFEESQISANSTTNEAPTERSKLRYLF